MTARASCGTHMGLLLHQDLKEEPCGTCARAERIRSLTAESGHVPETPPTGVEALIRQAVHALAVAMGTPQTP